MARGQGAFGEWTREEARKVGRGQTMKSEVRPQAVALGLIGSRFGPLRLWRRRRMGGR